MRSLGRAILQSRGLVCFLIVCLSLSSMAFKFFGREIVSRTEKGPHGGKLVFVDQRVPEYVEFVTIKRGEDWLVQVFTYDDRLRPMDAHNSAHVEFVLEKNASKEIDLWNPQHFSLPILSKQTGLLEACVPLGDVKEFRAWVVLRYNKLSPIRLAFSYP